ncbi:UbiX family flavin prenyltransferase [Selenomonas sp. TAMA-11512]|uniref:UbiX family flavin prenyltransferase n=1 Tax=Selenomonas sp. TAMA-11512 TaxID=3095337 RepID=UPI00308F7CB1|nr:UbiX family flavin prenyltransferase [Selenomonas sp. TAMA-11512]
MENKEIKTDQRIIVGATGASGSPLLIECLRQIRDTAGYEAELILTPAAELTLRQESDVTLEEVKGLAVRTYAIDSIGAPPASGSYPTAGMVIVPCSMHTLAGIHSGFSDNLLLRAADVTIKEGRRLVLAVRESPLSAIHLRNMQELALLSNVKIMPPMMTFYNRPDSIDEMVKAFAARLLLPFGIKHQEHREWTGI